MTDTAVPSHPPPELRYRRRVSPVAAVGELWQARELLLSVTERELRVRYKQAVLGFAWAVATPLALVAVFTLFFQRVADIDTGGAPYALFAYLGLLPWTFFSTSLSQGGQSLINNVSLLNKVYCPREIFPMGSVGVAAVDLAASLPALAVLFLAYGFAPRLDSLWFPVLLAVQVAFTVGATLIVSAVVVYLRDLRHALPIILQLGLFATPVAYGIDAVPEAVHSVYAGVNPLAAVIEGYRATVLLGEAPPVGLIVPGSVGALAYLVAGYLAFKRLETGFADVA